MRTLFEKKAKEGDGAFAVAFAILDLADAQEDTAEALHHVAVAVAQLAPKAN